MTSGVKSLLSRSFTIKAMVLLLSLFFIACSKPAEPSFIFSGATMGTTYHIRIAEPAKQDIAVIQQDVDQLLFRLNQLFSTYIEDSEISTLNREQSEHWVPVSSALFDVLMMSVEVGMLSDGAFDMTVGKLVNLWGFGPGKAITDPPEDAAITAMLNKQGLDAVELEYATNQIKMPVGVTIDLSAIAKGYAVDQVLAFLQKQGYSHMMVEIGGEIKARGKNTRGELWKIAIEQPEQGESRVNKVIALDNIAVATSGDYRNYFEKEGKRYSHTIDPRTGYPISHNLASVTVLHESASYADAFATAISVMGVDEGLALANQLGLAVYMLSKSDSGFQAIYSDAFAPYLLQGKAP
ncbi:FAD:protein FMN transferase [bacterium]|nr:FAD:protein FMN transferase [bacterium]